MGLTKIQNSDFNLFPKRRKRFMTWPEMNNLNQVLFEDVNDCEQMKKITGLNLLRWEELGYLCGLFHLLNQQPSALPVYSLYRMNTGTFPLSN